MLRSSLLAALFVLGLGGSLVNAQTAPATPAPAAPAAPAAPVPAPTTAPMAKPPRASASHTTHASLPAGTKVNLNTATASELDALPSIGKARTKVIMDERAKSPFKDWADFDKRTQHTSVNAGVKNKIKDLVAF